MGSGRLSGEKLKRKFASKEGYERKQKIKAGLYRKGFPFDLIDRFLDEHLKIKKNKRWLRRQPLVLFVQ